MHIASLILGIIAMITCFIPIFDVAVSFIALIIAIAAMCVKRPNNEGKGMKIAGLVLSIIAFVISLIMTGTILIGAKVIADNNEEIQNNVNELKNESDFVNAKTTIQLEYAAAINRGMLNGTYDGKAYDEEGNVMTAEDYYNILVEKEFGKTLLEIKSKYAITVDETGLPTSVEIK